MAIEGGGDSSQYILSWEEIKRGLREKREDLHFIAYIKGHHYLKSNLDTKIAQEQFNMKVVGVIIGLPSLVLFMIGVFSLIAFKHGGVDDIGFPVTVFFLGAVGLFAALYLVLDAFIDLCTLRRIEKRYEAIMAQ